MCAGGRAPRLAGMVRRVTARHEVAADNVAGTAPPRRRDDFNRRVRERDLDISYRGRSARDPLGYDPEDSKRYLRDLERYGGKANIVAGEITDWFNGLWHGRRLAFIVACVTVIVAGALLLAAIPMDSDLDESSNRTRRGEGDSP